MLSDSHDENYLMAMKKPFWFAIEGDNGAGKDTLADSLVRDGWFLPSRNRLVVEMKEQANRLINVDRVNAFLSYNQTCANLASEYKFGSFLVRYWPSTLAAGFADAVLSRSDFEDEVFASIQELPVPNLILHLKCRLEVRRIRVHQRGLIHGANDDVSEYRDQRYRDAFQKIIELSGSICWKTLDTSDLTAEQAYFQVQSILAEFGEKS